MHAVAQTVERAGLTVQIFNTGLRFLRDSDKPPALWRAALTGRVSLSIALNATRILRLFTVTGSTSDSRPFTPGYDFAQFHREDFRGRPVENNRDISNQIVDQVEPQEGY